MGGVSGDKLFITGKVRRQPPEDTVDTMIELRERYSRHVEEIGLEENAWQDLLAPIANYRCKELGVNPLPFTLINNRVKKEIRIERLGPYLQADQLRFEATPDMKLLVQQLEEFPMADHDDGPDALEMLLRVIENMITEPFTSESN
jgi:predicted phage terminase large subunit-like protein